MKLIIQNAKRCQDLWVSCPKSVQLALSRIDHKVLYYPFFAKLINAVENAHAQKKYFWVTQGMRSIDEQNALYAQGRTKPGGIVTKVIGGHSFHNYGTAADAVFDGAPEPGLQPSWKKDDLKYWADSAIEAGLDAGYYWKNFFDGPHVQLDVSKYGISAKKQLLAAYKKNGQEAVLAFLNQYDWT